MSGRRGFTLIEVLAACIATAVLAVALLTVIGHLTRDRSARSTPGNDDSCDALRLRRLLHSDLVSATAITIEKNPVRLRLTGPCGLDVATLRRDARQVQVEYRLATERGANVLVRSQTLIDERRATEPPLDGITANQMVAFLDVSSFDVQTLRPNATVSDADAALSYVVLVTTRAGQSVREALVHP